MAIKEYYVSNGDVKLAQDAVAKDTEMHIQEFIFLGTAVLDNTVPATATLTMTGVAFVVDELISTLATNLYIKDDNTLVCATVVDSNDALTVTFDSTTALQENDEATAGTFTDTNTYDVYILTPSNINAVGPFFGFTEGLALNISDELMEFIYNTPGKKIFTDLKMRTATIEGGNIDVSNKDVLQTIMGADEYGSQTGQYALGIGSDPDFNRYYKVTMLTTDRKNRPLQIIANKTQPSITGAINEKAESGHSKASFKFEILADGFYPDNADMIRIKRAD